MIVVSGATLWTSLCTQGSKCTESFALHLDVTDTHFSRSPVKHIHDLDSGAVTRTTCKSPVSRTSPAVSALVERECLWDAGKDQEAGDTHFRNKAYI